MADLTAERLRELLDYDPETGVFTWRVRRGSTAQKGTKAGCHCAYGYTVIRIDDRLHRANRLAWLYMVGEWPSEHVDHINRVRDDDRWSNLRLATNAQNCANAARSKNNKSGFKGVYWGRREQKWIAKITPNRKQKQLGCFDRVEDAAEAYKRAAIEYYGEFARED